MFSCGFCEISKNTISCRTPPVVASEKPQPLSQTIIYLTKFLDSDKDITKTKIILNFQIENSEVEFLNQMCIINDDKT